MATKKKPTRKKLSLKAQKMIQSDLFKSVAIASVLLNILFLVTVIVLTSTSTFDRTLFTATREHYCENSDGLQRRVKELGSKEAAAREWQVDCIGKEFKPFYKEAVDKYRAQANQE